MTASPNRAFASPDGKNASHPCDDALIKRANAFRDRTRTWRERKIELEKRAPAIARHATS